MVRHSVPTYLEVDLQQMVFCLLVVQFLPVPTGSGCLTDVDPSFEVVQMTTDPMAGQVDQMVVQNHHLEVLMVPGHVVNSVGHPVQEQNYLPMVGLGLGA